MSVLYLLERFRLPILNEFMLLITQLGEETAFLAVALIVFWCVDNKKGYFIMSVGFIGTMANNMLKLICRIPRPWVLDENFTILEQAKNDVYIRMAALDLILGEKLSTKEIIGCVLVFLAVLLAHIQFPIRKKKTNIIY